MENASKALIIAGAILLAILLISLGILIYNQAQDTVNNSGMSEAEKTAFNNQFLKYEGTQRGTVVKSLINEVYAVNAKLPDSDDVTVNIGGAAVTETYNITTSDTYTVSLGYDKGRVKTINITKN